MILLRIGFPVCPEANHLICHMHQFSIRNSWNNSKGLIFLTTVFSWACWEHRLLRTAPDA